MLLYSYHIVNKNGIEIPAEACVNMSVEEKKILQVQIRRHISPDTSIRVLSLVGGGIRGYMLGKVLEEIEERTGQKIAQLFDCIIGTSTGVPIAFALSYPQEVTVEDVISNPKLSEPHLATPKFSASMITKIYSHYGPYIFANPVLKRVLDPFIKGKYDDNIYFSAKEIDEQIEHEGAVIKIIAPNFQSVPDIKKTIEELHEKIELSTSLLDKILTSSDCLSVDPIMLAQHAKFLKTFLFYPLHKKIQHKFMDALKEYLEDPALLAAADTLTMSENISSLLDFKKIFIPELGQEVKTFKEECVIELKKYYLDPLYKLQDSIFDYEKLSATFFSKDGIEEVIKRFLPRGSQLQDLLGCTSGLACVRDTLELRILDNLDPNTRKISSYDAILASISAPVYFPSHQIGEEALIDAGFAVKNPSLVAFTLASKYFPVNHRIEIFEVGTAKTSLSLIQHPQTLKRILNPGESLSMVMEAGKNSTSYILNLLAAGRNPLLKYYPIDFDLGDEVFLEKTTPEYFDKMSEVVRVFVQDDGKFKSFIKAISSSFLDAHPIIPEGLSLIDVPDDGDCLYFAISIHIEQDAGILRCMAAEYLEKNVEQYQAFFVNETVTTKEYIRRLIDTNEWGGELEIVILSKVLNRPIVVIAKDGTVRNKAIIDDFYKNDEDITPIFVFYNDINHYSGLVVQEGYDLREILENLFTEPMRDQVDPANSGLSASYQFIKGTCQKFSAELSKHNLLQTKSACLLKHVRSKVIPSQLNDVKYFVQAYKKYSSTLYPDMPRPYYAEQAVVNVGGLPMMQASKDGVEIPILSIDGGGTRGIWPLKVLEYIEKSTGNSISEIFPIKGGTSVGGLISIILSIPNQNGEPFYKAKDVANLLKDAEQIFPLGWCRKARNLLNSEKGVMFDNSGLRTLLRKLIKTATGRDDLQMKDLIGINVGVLSYDNETLQPIFFSKISHAELSVVEAGVCTASAPVYLPDNSLKFNGKIYKMGDGGIPDNSPIWHVYGMFNDVKKPGELAKILSLGTGVYLNDHPKMDEAPFWLQPAALLGYGMDSRTIAQNSLMDIYFKTHASDISDFVRLQWNLPTSIDLTSSLPVTIPFETIPECLPIGYSGDNKIVDYSDLATIMAAKRMVKQDFINFMKDLVVVTDDYYSPIDNFNFMLKEQENKFQQTWAVRLADSIDIKIILLDFLDPVIKQDLFKLVYRICIGFSIVYEQNLKDKGINPELFFEKIDYAVLISNITKEIAKIGLDKHELISGYVHKINIILNFLNDKKETTVFLNFISDELNKMHGNGWYSEKSEVFLSYLIINTIKFMYNHPDLHEWVDYAERQLYNPNFLHKLAALTRVMPRTLAEPLVYSVGETGLSCLEKVMPLVNSTYFICKKAYTEYRSIFKFNPMPLGLTLINLSDQEDDMCCLYYALSLYLLMPTSHLRQEVINYLEKNMQQYLGCFEGQQAAETYIAMLKNTNKSGGALEVSILSKVLNRPIVVIGNNGKVMNKVRIDDSYEHNVNVQPIFVFSLDFNKYSGFVLSDEYSPRKILDDLRKQKVSEKPQQITKVDLQLTVKKDQQAMALFNVAKQPEIDNVVFFPKKVKLPMVKQPSIVNRNRMKSKVFKVGRRAVKLLFSAVSKAPKSLVTKVVEGSYAACHTVCSAIQMSVYPIRHSLKMYRGYSRFCRTMETSRRQHARSEIARRKKLSELQSKLANGLHDNKPILDALSVMLPARDPITSDYKTLDNKRLRTVDSGADDSFELSPASKRFKSNGN